MYSTNEAGAFAPAGYVLTGRGKLELAIRRLDLERVPDEVAAEIAAQLKGYERRRERVPCVGRLAS